MKVEYFLKKGFEIRDIQGKSLNKFILQEAKEELSQFLGKLLMKGLHLRND